MAVIICQAIEKAGGRDCLKELAAKKKAEMEKVEQEKIAVAATRKAICHHMLQKYSKSLKGPREPQPVGCCLIADRSFCGMRWIDLPNDIARI